MDGTSFRQRTTSSIALKKSPLGLNEVNGNALDRDGDPDFTKRFVVQSSSKFFSNFSLSPLINRLNSSKSVAITLFLISILSFLTRFYEIEAGNKVTWDEAHFGKFASHYLKREFYTDVHPPLGKMLVGLAGFVNGYNGTWDFKSASEYPEWVPYMGMRMFLATFGALACPLAFLTAVYMELSKPACILVGLSMLLDNGLIGISRLILLDSMLLFFTVSSTLGLVMFNSFSKEPFSLRWWASLLFTGLSIGLVSSVKWVGFFGVALIGLHTIRDLWFFLGDISKPRVHFVKQLGARFLCLIVVPIAVYMACFYIHFAILTHSGPGDAQMSSLFQAGLVGNDIAKSPFEVAFGSKITLRNRAVGGGLLHSHVQTYPEGSKQQQVTAYHHKDVNNEFEIRLPHTIVEEEGLIKFLKNGDNFRIVHVPTGRNLHSHPIPAPITKSDFEVSAYGNDTMFADINDHWTIELQVDSSGVLNDEGRIRSLASSFKLKHQATGCYLSSTKGNYPDWGFKQVEVSCQRQDSKDSFILWNVETHVNDKLPPAEPGLYRSHFLTNFRDVNVNMWRTNNALVPDGELEPSALTSSAYEWPFLLTGIRMTSFGDDFVKFYMAGNPVIWWLTGVSLVTSAFGLFALMACRKRRLMYHLAPTTASLNLFLDQLQVSLLGWLLHHAPFYLMGRVLYLHHYYPALFFAILNLAALFDRFVQPTSSKAENWSPKAAIICFLLATPIIATFWIFRPICYGIHGTSDSIDYLRWISSWPL